MDKNQVGDEEKKAKSKLNVRALANIVAIIDYALESEAQHKEALEALEGNISRAESPRVAAIYQTVRNGLLKAEFAEVKK